MNDKKRSVNLDSLSVDSIDNISSELNKKVLGFMKETENQRKEIDDKLSKLNELLSIYGINLKIGYEMTKI